MQRISSGLLAVLRELSLVIFVGLVYIVVRMFSEGDTQTALINAGRVLHLEESLGLAREGAVQSIVIGRDHVRTLANWMYIWGHWPLIAVISVGLFIYRRDKYRLLRNAVIISGLIGFIFFALMPTAPPRLANDHLVDTITVFSNSYRTFQPPRYTDQYASVPSLHFGWDLLVGLTLVLSTRKRYLQLLGVLMPICMGFAVVATANHWIIDVILGGAVAMVGFFISYKITPRDKDVPDEEEIHEEKPLPQEIAPRL